MIWKDVAQTKAAEMNKECFSRPLDTHRGKKGGGWQSRSGRGRRKGKVHGPHEDKLRAHVPWYYSEGEERNRTSADMSGQMVRH